MEAALATDRDYAYGQHMDGVEAQAAGVNMRTQAVNRINGWQASLRIEPETLYRRTSLDIPTVMELEDEVTSVQDEEVPADLDSQQEPKDLVDGEFDLAYLELASSTARLSRMHMVAATLSFTLRILNVPRVSASVIIRRKA